MLSISQPICTQFARPDVARSVPRQR